MDSEPGAVVRSSPVSEVEGDEEDRGGHDASGQHKSTVSTTTAAKMEVTDTPIGTEPQQTSSLLDMSLSSISSMSESQSQPSEGHSGAEVQGLNKDSQGLEDGEIKDETEEEFRTPSVLVSSSSKESTGSFGGRSSGRKQSRKSSSKKTGGSKDSEKYRSSSSLSATNSKRDKETKEKEKDRHKHRRSSGGRNGGSEDKEEKSSGCSSSSSIRSHQEDKHSSSSKKRRTSGGGGDSSGFDDLGSIYVRGVSPFSGHGGYGSYFGGGLSLVDLWNDPDPIVEFSNDSDSMLSRARKRKESGGEDVTLASSSSRHGHNKSHSKTEQPTLSHVPSTSGGKEGGFGRGPGSGDGPKDETGKGAEGDFGGLISKSDSICPLFMEGKCHKKKCDFSHDATPPRKMEVCKFFMMGCCAKKDRCIYLHNEFPCKYYHTGIVCLQGDKCKYSHSPLTSEMKQLLIKHLEMAPDKILGDFPRLTHEEASAFIDMTEAKHRGEFKDDGFKDRRQERHERGRSGGGLERDDEAGGHGTDRGARAGRRGDDEMNDNSGRGRKRLSRFEPLEAARNRQKLKELMQKPGHGIAERYKDTRGTGLLPIPLEYRGRPHPTHGRHGKGRGSHRSHPRHGGAGPKRLPFPNQLPSPFSSPVGPGLISQMFQCSTQQTQDFRVSAANVPPPNVPVCGTSSTQGQDSNDKGGLVGDGSNNIQSIYHGQVVTRDRLPKIQQELFLRMQKQQEKVENKKQSSDNSKMPEEEEMNWYSSDEEDSSSSGTKKVGDGGGAKGLENKGEVKIGAKIDSLLQQICQQFSSEREQSAAVSSSGSGSAPVYRYGVDFHRQEQTATASLGQNPASMGEKVAIQPVNEINSSLAPYPCMSGRMLKGPAVPKVDYSSMERGLLTSSIQLDTKLGKMISAENPKSSPASLMKTSTSGFETQPLTIPMVFDPKTAIGALWRAESGGPRRITDNLQQNSPFPISDNTFLSVPNYAVNEFPTSTDAIEGGHGPGPSFGPGMPQATHAQLIAIMHQYFLNMAMASGVDPNRFIASLAAADTEGQQMLTTATPAGAGPPPPQAPAPQAQDCMLRMIPTLPFNTPKPAVSSWEKLIQARQDNQEDDDDLSPPL